MVTLVERQLADRGASMPAASVGMAPVASVGMAPRTGLVMFLVMPRATAPWSRSPVSVRPAMEYDW